MQVNILFVDVHDERAFLAKEFLKHPRLSIYFYHTKTVQDCIRVLKQGGWHIVMLDYHLRNDETSIQIADFMQYNPRIYHDIDFIIIHSSDIAGGNLLRQSFPPDLKVKNIPACFARQRFLQSLLEVYDENPISSN